jgi:predicted solute-binding protein
MSSRKCNAPAVYQSKLEIKCEIVIDLAQEWNKPVGIMYFFIIAFLATDQPQEEKQNYA